MDDLHGSTSISMPRADAWLAAGLSAVAAGVWLLKRDDPYLLTLWGIGLVIIGGVGAVVGTGILLRLWR
jgi:hypothetical protein